MKIRVAFCGNFHQSLISSLIMISPIIFGPRCEQYEENIAPASKDQLELVPNPTHQEIEACSENISSKNLITHSDSVVESNNTPQTNIKNKISNSKTTLCNIFFLVN